jgi:predicted TPR repeat methyltransferase
MSPTEDKTSQAFFEGLYQRSGDPWEFATSEYELNRYAAVLRVVEERRFRRAFEPGCSIGILTKSLASFCGRVEAMDISPTAVDRARERCWTLANVNISQGALPEALPEDTFDLIALVAIGYYFPPPVLKRIVHSLSSRLEHGGVLLAEHWLGYSADHLLSGDQVHEIIRCTDGLVHDVSQRHDRFRIDLWSKT